jgi:Fic family protein
MAYNWQRTEWPNFTYNLSQVEEKLYTFSEKTGMVGGVLKSLPDDTQVDAMVEIMVAEAIKTSEIEGEFLSRKDVMSSIKKDLGLNPENSLVVDKRSKGIGQLMISVRETYQSALTEEQLFAWHTMLFGEQRRMSVGAWRSHAEPMQVVSGAVGQEKVHYEAPPSEKVPQEMERFIAWFNDTAPGGKNAITKAPVRCAIAHLYFESIHPFEDGNGRIGRCIAEKALSQGMGRPALLSLSRTIELNKNAYYAALQAAEQSIDITPWVNYFVDVILMAQEHAEAFIDFALKKAKFFDKYKDILTERQLKVVRRMLEEGPKGFEGGMNAGKYAALTKVAKATATRDLQSMLLHGAMVPFGTAGGRSAKYQLNI